MATGMMDAEFLSKPGRKRLNVGVGVDGSQMADRALAVAASFLDAKRGDQLYLMHVADSSKQYLPRHLQPQHLKNNTEMKAFEHKVRGAKWVQREKEGLSTCEALTALADDHNIDLMVAGSFGRKGEKLDMLGHVADYSLRQAHCSVCIVRPGSTSVAGTGVQYMIAVDSSHAAVHAFCVLVHLLIKPTDSVLAVHVSYGNNHEEAQACVRRYKEVMDANNVVGEVLIHNMDRSLTVADSLLGLARIKQVDTLVLGISGYSRAKLGSVSDEITHKADCTTIIIKDGYEETPTAFAGAGARSLAARILPRKSVHMEAAPPSLARTSASPSSLARSSVEAAAGSLARMSMDAGPRKSLSLARSSVPLVGSEQSFWQPPK